MSSIDHSQHTLMSPPVAEKVCDICGQDIEPGERWSDDGSEIAHTDCVSGWFSRNFGREALR